MIDSICAEVRNYFIRQTYANPVWSPDIHSGTFKIEGGVLPPLGFIKDGQYIRIVGSTFNDGVYQYPATDLTDEEFVGAIWTMNLPKDFLELCKEIEEFQASDAAKPTAYASESFGGYSYTKNKAANGQTSTWREVFATRLDRWRRARIL